MNKEINEKSNNIIKNIMKIKKDIEKYTDIKGGNMREINNQYKICFQHKKTGQFEKEIINLRIVYAFDEEIIEQENKEQSIEYDLNEKEICIEGNIENINKYINSNELDKIYGWNRNNISGNPLVLLEQIEGLTFSQHVNKATYQNKTTFIINRFLDNICTLIKQESNYSAYWVFIGEYKSNFELLIEESKRKTLEWLAIKTRLIEKGYDKDDFKIKIGYCYYDYDERYPLYLNVCEDYYNSFRLDIDKRFNAARSIFELIIYKEEWYDTMYFTWDNEALETYKYLFFLDKKEFKDTNAEAIYFDSEFDYMCCEEEQCFRG